MSLKAHFLNVGSGDCTIIEFPSGRIGIVDIYNLKILDEETKSELLQEFAGISREYLDSKAYKPFLAKALEEQYIKKEQEKLTDPLFYYNDNIGQNTEIFRLMVTHPDMDHMTGLYRLYNQEQNKTILNFWHTGMYDFNLSDTSDEEWENSPYDKRDWDTYKALRLSENAPKSLQKYQGDTGDFWTEDGIEIWAPTKDLEKLAIEKEEPNILSMILKISYKGKSIVLGGDATADETWSTIYPKIDMKGVHVLKASHHGRKSGYHMESVKEMSPWLTITSVGDKEHDATDNYRRYSTYTVSLLKAGDFTIEIGDDGILYYSPNIANCWKPQIT
jgi:competence protein ComEC